MKEYATVSEFRKAVKALVKGAIKSKLFGGEDGKYVFEFSSCYCKKTKTGYVKVTTGNDDGLAIVLEAPVSTRVYNKVNDEFFTPIVAQFTKLKSVNDMTFYYTAYNDCEADAEA